MWQTRGLPVDAIVPANEKPTRATAICPRRLRKAARLIADRMGPGQYAVRGDSGKVYYVDLSQEIPCMCPDSEFNAGLTCKHRLRAMMGEGDVRILQALGDMMLRDQQHLRDYTRATRHLRRAAQRS